MAHLDVWPKAPSTDTCRLLGGGGLDANELEGGPHLETCPHHPQRELSNMAATTVCAHASPGDSPRPAGRSDSGSYQVTTSVSGPGACEILYEPFKSEFFLADGQR